MPTLAKSWADWANWYKQYHFNRFCLLSLVLRSVYCFMHNIYIVSIWISYLVQSSLNSLIEFLRKVHAFDRWVIWNLPCDMFILFTSSSASQRRPSSPVVVTDHPSLDHAYSSSRLLEDDAPSHSSSSSSSIDEEYDFGDAGKLVLCQAITLLLSRFLWLCDCHFLNSYQSFIITHFSYTQQIISIGRERYSNGLTVLLWRSLLQFGRPFIDLSAQIFFFYHFFLCLFFFNYLFELHRIMDAECGD